MIIAAIVAGAFGHVELLYPPSREGGDVLKVGPCGRAGMTRSANVTSYVAGETITVRFDEYIDHPGHFRIALDLDGDDAFADPPCVAHCTDRTDPDPPEFDFGVVPEGMIVLADHIADTPGTVSEIEVTLPEVSCDNCTLQVIQVMYDKRPITVGGNDVYYQCADLVITGGAVAEVDEGAAADEGAGPDAGAETDAGAEAVVRGAADDGCAAAPGAELLTLLLLRNRRRR